MSARTAALIALLASAHLVVMRPMDSSSSRSPPSSSSFLNSLKDYKVMTDQPRIDSHGRQSGLRTSLNGHELPVLSIGEEMYRQALGATDPTKPEHAVKLHRFYSEQWKFRADVDTQHAAQIESLMRGAREPITVSSYQRELTRAQEEIHKSNKLKASHEKMAKTIEKHLSHVRFR